MTVNSEKVLNALKAHYGEEFSKQQLANMLGISIPAVTGSINALIKKNYVVTTRTETIEEEPATETKKAKIKVVPYHTLTEAGLSYDPVAEEAAKQAEKEAARAARAAEKAARQAAREAAE